MLVRLAAIFVEPSRADATEIGRTKGPMPVHPDHYCDSRARQPEELSHHAPFREASSTLRASPDIPESRVWPRGGHSRWRRGLSKFFINGQDDRRRQETAQHQQPPTAAGHYSGRDQDEHRENDDPDRRKRLPRVQHRILHDARNSSPSQGPASRVASLGLCVGALQYATRTGGTSVCTREQTPERRPSSACAMAARL